MKIMFGNSIPFGPEFEFVDLETNKKTNVGNAISCLRRLREYQARLIFAAELLTEWGVEPAAAERFGKEVKAANDMCHDVFGKMCNTMTAKGMKNTLIQKYMDKLDLHDPWNPNDRMIYGFLRSGDTARTIADRTLDAWEI
jgi:hypothetical protein